MPVQRKIFRIEESDRTASRATAVVPAVTPAASHEEFLSELKALRALIEPQAPPSREAFERARAQIAEADALRTELAAIHGAIESSRAPMHELEGAMTRDAQLRRAVRELEAIVAVTEQATQRILHAVQAIQDVARDIEHSSGAADCARLTALLGESAILIVEACNFQDLTGQQAGNVIAKVQRVEVQITRLLQIWRSVGQFQPVVFDAVEAGDRRYLNGPKLADDAGHSSQDEINAIFDAGRG